MIEMTIAEFKTKVQTQKRLQIPSRINVEEGEEILVKIYRIKKEVIEKGGN